jgi:hypothetical protein
MNNKDREKVLETLEALREELRGDREKSLDFLMRVGLIDENGELIERGPVPEVYEEPDEWNGSRSGTTGTNKVVFSIDIHDRISFIYEDISDAQIEVEEFSSLFPKDHVLSERESFYEIDWDELFYDKLRPGVYEGVFRVFETFESIEIPQRYLEYEIVDIKSLWIYEEG